MDFIYKIENPFKIIGLFSTFSTNLNSSLKFEHIFGNISFITLFIAVLLYWFDFSDTKPVSKKIKSFCMIGANLSLTCLLALRWWESGHFPLSNLYESLIGLSWSFTSVHLFVTLNSSNMLGRDIGEEGDKIGAITAPTALLTSVFATFFLPTEMLRATTLIPALKSNWLTMHVTVMIISYAFLLVGSLLSMAFCAYKFWLKFFEHSSVTLASQNYNYSVQQKFAEPERLLSGKKTSDKISPQTILQGAFSGPIGTFGSSSLQMPSSEQTLALALSSKSPGLDSGEFSIKHTVVPQGESLGLITNNNWPTNNSSSDRAVSKNNLYQQERVQSEICIWLNTMSYRILGLGFPLLTIGILSGAVWANEAWGSYWSWDPKETWALITWLVFAIYFHSRYNRSSDISIVPASIASVGFIIIWICYLGVNLLQSGLHSYGWFAVLFSLNIF